MILLTYTADFETTTNADDCRVWAWGLCEVGKEKTFECGNSIDSFFKWCAEKRNIAVYFHNLKFDGNFIIYWLLKHGYAHVRGKKSALTTKTFKTLISDKGVFYSIKICFLKNKNYSKILTIYDSMKVLPFSVSKVAQAFNLPLSKLELDYNTYREPGHILTDSEKEYLKHDVVIMALALDILFKQNLNKMTTASNAFHEYKEVIGEMNFKRWFPPPAYDEDIRRAYKGGFTYANPRYQGCTIGEGIVLDVNSLYPWVMYNCALPYGEGIFFDGKYKYDKRYNLYVQSISCSFKLKKGMIPTIQMKNNLSFVPTEYLESSNGENVILYLTNVDLELFLEHYEVYDLEYINGWKFKCSTQLFKKYIDIWMKVKRDATRNGNSSLRTIAKLMLNSLYGKFALNPVVRSKYPVLGEDDKVHYVKDKEEHRDPVYIPVGVFITAWARHKTITSAQSVYDRFLYADTDSLHLIDTDIPDGLSISDTELGCWKIETQFKRAKFLHAKCYVEEESISEKEFNEIKLGENFNLAYMVDGEYRKLNITCAGLPERCYNQVTFDNFKIGARYFGKLQPEIVSGGVILKEREHTLREK